MSSRHAFVFVAMISFFVLNTCGCGYYSLSVRQDAAVPRLEFDTDAPFGAKLSAAQAVTVCTALRGRVVMYEELYPLRSQIPGFYSELRLWVDIGPWLTSVHPTGGVQWGRYDYDRMNRRGRARADWDASAKTLKIDDSRRKAEVICVLPDGQSKRLVWVGRKTAKTIVGSLLD